MFRYSIYTAYWLVPLVVVGSILYLFISNSVGHFRTNRWISYLVAFFVLFYVPKLFIISFQFIEDLGKIGAWMVKKISQSDGSIYAGAETISKSVYLGKVGLIIAIIPFISIIYGVLYGRFNFKLKEVSLQFDHLPAAFDGFRIVQFSDFHAGSLIGQQDKFIKAFNLINSQKPDIIVFTGDMVNNTADEAKDWVEMLAGLKALAGKFSILGNHDYGDYYRWDSDSAKKTNLDLLKYYHKQMDFKLLLNDAVVIEKNGDSIALIGVENWGEKPFPQHGDLKQAMENIKEIPFKILLSHDPSHWEYEVREKTDIALTLSGHTHGMQLAVNIAGFSWSPVSLKYPRWNGLYTDKSQYLYVNIGLGYIGFPGRVGTNPEITVFTLHRKQ
jgi:predicted MPP superfamily phosphohydrolase